MTTEPEDQFLPEGPTPTWLVSLDAPEPDPEKLSAHLLSGGEVVKELSVAESLEAARLMEKIQKKLDLAADIQSGLDSGPAVPLDMDEIKRRARERRAIDPGQ